MKRSSVNSGQVLILMVILLMVTLFSSLRVSPQAAELVNAMPYDEIIQMKQRVASLEQRVASLEGVNAAQAKAAQQEESRRRAREERMNKSDPGEAKSMRGN